MRFKIAALFVAGLTLAACETPSQQDATTTGGGSSAATTDSSTRGTGAMPGVSSREVGPDMRPGSVEEFVASVGDRVYFGFDRFDLSPEAQETLEKQSVWLKQHGKVVVTVAGHADERGTREYNLALGEKRANAVKNYLVALGVSPDRIRTISYGKERPVDPRSSEDAWAKNRRSVTMVDTSSVSMSN